MNLGTLFYDKKVDFIYHFKQTHALKNETLRLQKTIFSIYQMGGLKKSNFQCTFTQHQRRVQ
jgi:hypothetical protein